MEYAMWERIRVNVLHLIGTDPTSSMVTVRDTPLSSDGRIPLPLFALLSAMEP